MLSKTLISLDYKTPNTDRGSEHNAQYIHNHHEELTIDTKHILLMDEKPIMYISDLISDLLEDEEDMRVTAPSTLLEDVVEIGKLQPDLILMALRLDGTQQRVWSCVQHLKSHQATKDI